WANHDAEPEFDHDDRDEQVAPTGNPGKGARDGGGRDNRKKRSGVDADHGPGWSAESTHERGSDHGAPRSPANEQEVDRPREEDGHHEKFKSRLADRADRASLRSVDRRFSGQRSDEDDRVPELTGKSAPSTALQVEQALVPHVWRMVALTAADGRHGAAVRH